MQVQEDLLLDKLIYRLNTTGERFFPKNLFKLINYVRFSECESHDVIARRILILMKIRFVGFKSSFAIYYQIEKAHLLEDFDSDQFEDYFQKVRNDSEYVRQMILNGGIDLRHKEFSNFYNLVSAYIRKDKDYVLAVTCHAYIYQRTEIAL